MKPIETAPKKFNEPILLRFNGQWMEGEWCGDNGKGAHCFWGVTLYDENNERVLLGGTERLEVEPTHWAKLPSDELETLRAENEAKDAQIKVLVEALETRHLITCRSFDRPYFQCDCGTAEDLSAIPAEALEKWKLERELIEMVKITDEADYESCKRLARAILQLNHFEAHREKVEND